MKRLAFFAAALGAFLFSGLTQAKTDTMVLNTDNFIVVRGEITSESVSPIIQQIFSSKEKTLTVYINSPGGSVFAGNQLITAMKGSGKHFQCVASVAASMAFVVLQACDERLVTRNSIIMQHVASYALEGQMPNNITFNDFLIRMLKSMDKEQADRIGMTLPDFEKKIRDDWWMFDGEAVDQRAADRVVSVSCTPTLADKKVEQKIMTFFGDINLTWSGCPLVTYPLKVAFGRNFGIDDAAADKFFQRYLDTFNAKEYLFKQFGVNPPRR